MYGWSCVIVLHWTRTCIEHHSLYSLLISQSDIFTMERQRPKHRQKKTIFWLIPSNWVQLKLSKHQLCSIFVLFVRMLQTYAPSFGRRKRTAHDIHSVLCWYCVVCLEEMTKNWSHEPTFKILYGNWESKGNLRIIPTIRFVLQRKCVEIQNLWIYFHVSFCCFIKFSSFASHSKVQHGMNKKKTKNTNQNCIRP